jgi:NAD(P)-dependent dehydrogenase (short-subunit alcohol dehydrogenase family)
MAFEINLTGKVALVTGGATGIGAATCIALARAGATIALNCFPDKNNTQEKPADAENVVRTIRKMGGTVEMFPGDVSDEAWDKRVVEDIVGRWGRIDILVNNAVLFRRAKMLELTTDVFRRMFEVNVMGPFVLSQACIPHMLKQGGGSIIFISSSNVVNGGGDTPAYPACKGALEGMMKNMVKEFGKKAIRTNVIRPSVIVTPPFIKRYTEEQWNAYLSCIPTARAGKPEDVANLIVYLCDDEKAAYLNGGVYHVDGARIHQIHPTSN